MPRHWTSQKTKSVVNAMLNQLDLLFEFSSTDPNKRDSYNLQDRILGLIDTTMTATPGGRKILSAYDYGRLLPDLQKHVRNRFKIILDNSKMLVEMPLWQFSSSLEFTFDPIGKRFHQRFRFHELSEGDEIQILKQAVDLAMMQILQDLDFRPDRLHKCPRCQTYYYQATDKNKKYCSTRCSDSVRLQQFRKNRRLAGKGGVKAV